MAVQKERYRKPDLSSHRAAGRIALTYAMIGGVWIIFSDRLLANLIQNPTLLTQLQTTKGWLFVGITALLIFWLIDRYLTEVERSSKERGESEERFQAIFRSAPVSIWEIDLSLIAQELHDLKMLGIRGFGRYCEDHPGFVLSALQQLKVVDVNETTLRLFGVENKTALFDVLPHSFLPESLDAFRKALIAIVKGEERFETEAIIINAQRERKQILITLDIPTEKNLFGNLPVSVMDITERKVAEERLRLLESAVQQISEGITITTAELDPPGPRIVYVNPAFSRITGYSAEEAIGKTPRILQGPKTDRAVLDLMLQRLWLRQTFRGETINYRKDGAEFIMEWYVAPITNKAFQVNHFVGVQRDITEQRRAEEAIKEREAVLQVIFDQAFQLMGLLKADGTLIKINRTASDFIKARDAEVLGKPFWETPWWTHSPEQQQRLRDAIEAAARGEFVRFEATHPTSDGKLVYVDFSLKPVRDETGSVVLLVPEGRDITERKLAEEEIHKLNYELNLRIAELEEANARLKETCPRPD